MGTQQVSRPWPYNHPQRMRLLRVIAGAGLVAMIATLAPHAQTQTDEPATAPGLTPTVHPALPVNPAHYWLAPDLAQRTSRGRATTVAIANLVKAVGLLQEEKFAAAIPLIAGSRRSRGRFPPCGGRRIRP